MKLLAWFVIISKTLPWACNFMSHNFEFMAQDNTWVRDVLLNYLFAILVVLEMIYHLYIKYKEGCIDATNVILKGFLGFSNFLQATTLI